MILFRFSHTAFTAQYQSKMKEQFDYIKNFKQGDLEHLGMTEWAKNMTTNHILSKQAVLSDDFSFYGIHVFFDTAFMETNDSYVRLLLNHLMERPPLHQNDFNENILAYDLEGAPFLKTRKMLKLQELRSKGHIGAYVPFGLL